MARGQSPYQGRYTVPIHDYSAIERGGAAWGDAMQSVGQSIAAGIKEHGLDKEKKKKRKEERQVMKGEFNALLKQATGIQGEIESNMYSNDATINQAASKTVGDLISDFKNDPDMPLRQKLATMKIGMSGVRQSLTQMFAKHKTGKQYPQSPFELFNQPAPPPSGVGPPPPGTAQLMPLRNGPSARGPQIPPRLSPQAQRPPASQRPSAQNLGMPPPVPGDIGPTGQRGRELQPTFKEFEESPEAAFDEEGLPKRPSDLSPREEEIWKKYHSGTWGEKEGDQLDTLIDNIKDKRKLIDDYPEKLLDFRKKQVGLMTDLHNLQSAKREIPMNMEEANELVGKTKEMFKGEGFDDIEFTISGTGNNAKVSFDLGPKEPTLHPTTYFDSNSKKLVPLDGILNDGATTPNFYHVAGGKLSKLFTNPYEAAKDRVEMLVAQKKSIWNLGQLGINEKDGSKFVDVDFAQFHRVVNLIHNERGKGFHLMKEINKGKDFGKGKFRFYASSGMLEVDTENPKDGKAMNYELNTKQPWFEEAMGHYDKYRSLTKQIQDSQTAGISAGMPGGAGKRGPEGEGGMTNPPPAPPPSPRPSSFPPRSYDRQDILDQIRR